jgi:hypothetical protein
LTLALDAITGTYELSFQILRNCIGNHVDEEDQIVHLYTSELCGYHCYAPRTNNIFTVALYSMQQITTTLQVSAAGVCVAHFQLSKEEKELYSELPVLVYGEQGMMSPSIMLHGLVNQAL